MFKKLLVSPQFWAKPSVIALALSPFCGLYLLVFYLLKIFAKPYRSRSKIICLGNFTIGGQGKTPCVIALAKLLNEMSKENNKQIIGNYAFISRGYGRKNALEFIEVQEHMSANVVGDEPLLLAKYGRVFIGAKRCQLVKKIEEKNNFSILIMDDGLQNNSLHKDLKIVVVDEKIMFGNNLTLPAGPLREPVSIALKNIDLVIFVSQNNAQIPEIFSQKKVIKASLETLNHQQFVGKKIIAFCGIAYPEKFFTTLSDFNLEVVETIPYPDHYNYQESDFKFLNQRLNFHSLNLNKNNSLNSANPEPIILLTTKKDWVKFSPSIQKEIAYLDVEIKFANQDLIKEQIKKLF